ncbi:MAG: DUF3047 domain-containing protein [Pseudomonadota bacterium]
MSLPTKNADRSTVTRREALAQLSRFGIAAPLALSILHSANSAAAHALLEPGELAGDINAMVKANKPPGLTAVQSFRLVGNDLPWKPINLTVEKGQQITFLLSGRWWLVKELDIWVEPGLAFFARAGGQNPIYNPQSNTGTFVAPHSGEISIARAIGEWQNDEAQDVATPKEVYQKAEGWIEGVALVWDADPLAGLSSLLKGGDSAGIVAEEINRLRSQPPDPQGWKPLYVTGNPGIFSSCDSGQICCHSHKNACLLKNEFDLPLSADAQIDWRWVVEELPSRKREDQLLTHDYLSVAVEFDDGQDLTYFWSSELPVGQVFRCPIPSWAPIETHMVLRSGHAELGQWKSESRNLFADYKEHIGGDAKRVVGVWLIALSFFQRGTGKARFADMNVSAGEQSKRLIA